MNANVKLIVVLALVTLRAVGARWNAGAPPVFLTSPTNQTVYEGDPITIECTASYDAGTTFFFYSGHGQPFTNPAPVFYFSSAWDGLSTNNNRILATNSFGVARSEPFNLSVLPSFPSIYGPTFLSWDLGVAIVLSNGMFSVQGKPPLTYSLFPSGIQIQKTTQLNFGFANVTYAQAGSYQLIVENSLGSATNAFQVLVPDSLRIVSRPKDQLAPLGGTATFDVVANIAGPIRYQWSHNGSNVNSGTTASLGIMNASLADTGNYRCALTVQNGAGEVVASLQTENVFLDIDSPRAIDHWQRLSPKFGGADLFGVANGGGITVAVAGNGTIWKSTNRIDWTPATSPVSDALLEVAYGNDGIVAVGSQLPHPSGRQVLSR